MKMYKHSTLLFNLNIRFDVVLKNFVQKQSSEQKKIYIYIKLSLLELWNVNFPFFSKSRNYELDFFAF